MQESSARQNSAARDAVQEGTQGRTWCRRGCGAEMDAAQDWMQCRREGSDFSFRAQFLSTMSRFFSPSFNSVTQADSYTVYHSPATGLLCHISPVNLPALSALPFTLQPP